MHKQMLQLTVFDKSVDAVAQYVTKGRQVRVTGRIQVKEKKFFKVIASRVQFGHEPRSADVQVETPPGVQTGSWCGVRPTPACNRKRAIASLMIE
jgi:hypothetical protein